MTKVRARTSVLGVPMKMLIKTAFGSEESQVTLMRTCEKQFYHLIQ